MSQSSHYILYDATCPVCQKAIKSIQKWDKNRLFSFIPLEGEKSRELCQNHPEYLHMNTVILVEEGKVFWIKAKAFFRILWLLGGKWKWLGWLYHLPGWMINPFYSLFARFRHFF